MVCLHIILPRIEPASISSPLRCAARTCRGTRFRLHQQVAKPLRDSAHPKVVVYRYRCLTCGHTFRVYPHGVTHAHTSLRVLDLAALLYRLGLSYAAVSTALGSWKVYLCKSQVYRAVRSVEGDPPPPRGDIFRRVRTQPNADHALLIHCQGSWVPAALMADRANRLLLTLNMSSREAAEECRAAVMAMVAAKGVEISLTASAEERKWLGIDSTTCQDADIQYHQTSNARAR